MTFGRSSIPNVLSSTQFSQITSFWWFGFLWTYTQNSFPNTTSLMNPLFKDFGDTFSNLIWDLFGDTSLNFSHDDVYWLCPFLLLMMCCLEPVCCLLQSLICWLSTIICHLYLITRKFSFSFGPFACSKSSFVGLFSELMIFLDAQA